MSAQTQSSETLSAEGAVLERRIPGSMNWVLNVCRHRQP
jgi:hypothetical protein